MNKVKLSRLELPKPSLISLYRDHTDQVSAGSNSAQFLLRATRPVAETSQYSTSQIPHHFTSHRITIERILSTDISPSSSNIFVELGEMENNDRTLKELATPDVRGPPQALEGIPHGLFHNETVGDPERLHQDEGVPILTRRSCKGLAISSANTFQHLGRHEAHISREVLSGIHNCVHQEVDLWDKAAYRRDSARILGEVQ
ncbi:hypothetical protein CR513_53473, partial [Mucuna pruriens]